MMTKLYIAILLKTRNDENFMDCISRISLNKSNEILTIRLQILNIDFGLVASLSKNNS